MRTPGYSEVKRAQTSKLSDLDSCTIAFAVRIIRYQEIIPELSIVIGCYVLSYSVASWRRKHQKQEIWMAVSSKIVRVGEILAFQRASHIVSSVLSLYLNCTPYGEVRYILYLWYSIAVPNGA